MRFLVYLFTLLLFSTAVAQNPVILQGSYVTNVFGPSNFIKNPNAQNNTSDVFTSGGVITRSLTTPLVATTEFNVTTNTSTNNIYWTTRTFDAGTKNQNCEARFTYRGFTTGTTTAQITNNNTTVIAELVLVPSASDPRTVSINFPCGDPSTSKELRLQQSVATLTGVNEIGGIYMGLATNMANVAQAEAVGGYNITVSGVYPQTTSSVTANLSLGSSTLVPFGKATSADAASGSVTFSYLPAGNYSIVYTAHSVTGIATSCIFQWYEDTSGQQSGFQYSANDTNWSMVSGYFAFTSGGSRTFRIRARRTGGSGICGIDPNLYAQMVVYRFPSSSELVVTPERQNVFGGVSYAPNTDFIAASTSEAKVTDGNFGARTFYGKGTLAGTGCGLASGDMGFCLENVPPGTYRIASNLEVGSTEAGTDKGYCTFRIKAVGSSVSATDVAQAIPHSIGGNSFTPIGTGIIKITSFQSYLGIYLTYIKSSNADNCVVRSDSSNGAYAAPSIQISPLDQPTNSALYVQGPVKAAETGAAISAGYVGQQISWNSPSSQYLVPTSFIDWSNANLTVTPGVWLLIANINAQAYADASGNDVACSLRITNSSGTLINNQEKAIRVRGGSTAGSAQVTRSVLSYSTVVNVSTSTLYKLQIKLTDNAGINNSCNFYNESSAYSEFFAIRLN